MMDKYKELWHKLLVVLREATVHDIIINPERLLTVMQSMDEKYTCEHVD